MTVNELIETSFVNLQLTNGCFYIPKDDKQLILPNTKIVLQRKSDDRFFDNFTGLFYLLFIVFNVKNN